MAIKLAVVGGAGHLGSHVAEYVRQEGFAPRVVDRDEPRDPTLEFRRADALNTQELIEAFEGCDAVAHFATRRGPSLKEATEVFVSCTGSTFAVLEAARACGIRSVVVAGSINALGSFFGLTPVQFTSFPVHVDHPPVTSDPYSFGKHMAEEVCRYHARTWGTSSVVLRIPLTYPAEAEPDLPSAMRFRLQRRILDRLQSMPAAEAERAVREATLTYDSWRSEGGHLGAASGNLELTREMKILMERKVNLFTMLSFDQLGDLVVHATRAMLSGRASGAHTLFASDPQNGAGLEPDVLIRLVYPEASGDPPWNPAGGSTRFETSASLVDLSPTEELLGWRPESMVPRLEETFRQLPDPLSEPFDI